MLAKINPLSVPVFEKLADYADQLSELTLHDLFSNDADRFKKFSHQLGNIFIDYSKNHIDEELMTLLISWAESIGFDQCKNALFNGQPINEKEQRAVLHNALRNPDDYDFELNGVPIQKAVKKVQSQIADFTNSLHNGKHLGYSGKKITDIVNIGIGGSDLGPMMVCEALKPYWKEGIEAHFVSNVDGWHIYDTLHKLNPETTLFIIASKTFTTQETLANAHSARSWFLENGGAQSTISKHFVAVSTNAKAVAEFGISLDNMFEFWDWVGGRFSLWSAIGLSIACTIGYEKFKELLDGAAAMDDHFFNASNRENIPLILGLISCYYIQFFDIKAEAVIPYDQRLHRFPAFLQQGIMESNGKYVDRNGFPVEYPTSSIIFGEPGTNAQHSFFQLLHQGTHIIPVDFIVAIKPNHPYTDQHRLLVANCLAQAEALMKGKNAKEVRQDLEQSGLNSNQIAELLPYKVFPGNRPSTTIVLQELDPFSLGQLIAMYEHKIFVQGVIWNIFSFDQWGVELGKSLASKINKELQEGSSKDHDSSTSGLMNMFYK